MTLTVDWRTQAACLDDPDRQFPGNVAEEIAAAKRVCAGCPVRDKCLGEALERRERDGVWGGLTYGERKNLALYGVPSRFRMATCPVCKRDIQVGRKGLRRHDRKDPAGAKGRSHCPGKKP